MKLRAWRSLESSDPCHGSDHGFKSRRPRRVVLGDKSYTFDVLGGIFGKKPVNLAQNLDSSRADINLFLGEDYFMRYNTRN